MYHPVSELITDHHTLLCAICGWFVAQVLKIPTDYVVHKKLNLRRIVGSGGMPSSHSSFVVALAIMVGSTEGWGSSAFAISFVLAAIVMYDAAGVRLETGKQGQAINKILQAVLIDGQPITDDNLKEIVGHKPIEVLGGALVGLFVALFFLNF